MTLDFLDTPAALQRFLNGLGDCDGQPPRFYMDLEGNNLSRRGTLSLVTILLEPEKTIHVVDVTTLGQQAFTTAGRDGRTLQTILESNDIIKVFFDIRNDSDALFGLHGICVAGIEDLQLMELASRTFAKRNVNGLAKCIERDSKIGFQGKWKWQAVKQRGKRLFDPQLGGSYAVFDRRPLSDEVKDYCTQDVALMPHLRDIYRGKLCDAWWMEIGNETDARIRLSQSPSFMGKGQHMALGPSRWLSWEPSAAERACRTLLQVAHPRTWTATSSASAKKHDEVSPQSREADKLADMIQHVTLTDVGRHFDTDSDGGDMDESSGRGPDFHATESEGEGDLSVCDKECGRSGRCDS